MGISYRDAGVDVEGGNKFVKKIAPIVQSTFTKRVITDIGGFGALYSGSFPEMAEPVLVSGTDGVGTKLKIAQLMNKHDTIGIDAVAMCVNDILVSGAAPLFFLDYISCGKLNEPVMVDIVSGIAEGCRIAGCSLVGGETAEHPLLMPEEEYDIAGFAVGVVDRRMIINGTNIKKGDIILGLPSSGVHSNGYSLVRKLLFEIKGFNVNTALPEISGSLGSVLLTPTRIYCKSVLNCIKRANVIKGMVHITGGGFYENIPRILPPDVSAVIEKSSFEIHPIFKLIQKEGDIEEREMFTTFNMGIGMMIIADKTAADEILDTLKNSGEKPVVLGDIVQYNKERVILK